MDTFGPTASSFSSFAFAQAGTFLFQFNPETDKPVLADPELLPELKNLRLGHSLIRDSLEKYSDNYTLRSPDLLEYLVLYTNAIRNCSATAQHLRLQSDPKFLKDARLLSRQRNLLEALREARRHSEKLQYRFDRDASLPTRLNVASKEVQGWLDDSLGPDGLDAGPSLDFGLTLDPNIFWKWTTLDRNLLWCTSTVTISDSEDRGVLGLAVAHQLLNSRKGFVAYTYFSHTSKELEPTHALCHLLGQIVASEGMQLSTVLKGWFLSHKNTRPSLGDSRRMLFNELQHKKGAYLIFSLTAANRDELEAFLPIFHDILQIGCKLFVICPFSLPAELNSEGWIRVTEEDFQGKVINNDGAWQTEGHQRSIWRGLVPSPRIMGYRFDVACLLPQEEVPSFSEDLRQYLKQPNDISSIIANGSPNEQTQLDTMLRELVSDASPAAKVSLKMLVWLAFTQIGLTLGELQAAIADNPNHLAVLDGTNPLTRLDYFLRSIQGAQGNDTFHIKRVDMGQYLRWWLCDEDGIHTDGPHALIAEGCLSYLRSVFNSADLPGDDGEFDKWINARPLLRYAGSNWGEHARKVVSPSDQHTGLIESLLESRQVEGICASMLAESEKSARRHRGAYKEMTGLHLASAFGLVNLVSRMIASGRFSPCLRTDDGWTALHWAVEKFHKEVASFLLALPDKESFISYKTNSEGCTALHIAVKHLRISMVEAILKAKADVNAQDSRGRTPLYLAVWSVQEDVVKMLLSSGADPNIPSIYGTTLHCATKRGASSLVQTLISVSGSRIDLDAKDVHERTALEEAQTRRRDDVVAILLEAGAKPSFDLILTQAYILGGHRGLSSKESWQAYEIDSELSCQIRQGNQCTCHVLKSQKQKLGNAEGQVTLEHNSEGDAAPPTRVFRKTFDLASDAQGQVQKYLLSEWQILFKLRHPHIVRYIDSDEDPIHNEFLLYMEYCDRGDVESCHRIQLKDLKARENKRYGFVEDETRSNMRPLSGIEIWGMIWQMASALAYLHYGFSIKRENGRYGASVEGQWAYIIHRDVKPANIVMHGTEKDRFLFKLCDLGIASHAGLGPDQNQTQLIGSSGLQPPTTDGTQEVRQGELWTTRGDIFSLGETIRLTAKVKDGLLDCRAFKSFLDRTRGIDEDSRPTSLEAMETAYENLRKVPGSFSELPRAVVEEMRSVHQVLGRWSGSYLLQSFLLTAELLDSSQPFQLGLPTDDRQNLVKRLWLLLDDGAAETFTGRYELPLHLLILLEGRSAEEKQSRKVTLEKILKTSANINHQWVKSGWSALHIAAQEGNLSALKTLLRYGAEVDLKDKHGMTAKDYAKANGFDEFVVLLDQAEKAAVEQQRGEVRENTRKRMRLV